MKLLILSALLLPLPLAGQSTYTAATANESDVNAIINGPAHVAINGDIIQIPCSGSSSVTWSSQLTVNANITLTGLGAVPNSGPSTFGSGTNCLTITSAVSVLLAFNPTYAATNNLTTIQNMIIVPGSGAYNAISVSGTGTSSGMPNIRINNIQFGNSTAQWQIPTNGEFVILANNVFGVEDHNTLVNGSQAVFTSINLTSYLGVGSYGDNSWAQPDTMGGANDLFIENNILYQGGWPATENEYPYPFIGGGRAVMRFNQVFASNGATGGLFFLTGGHGLDTDGRLRAMRHQETYGNTINYTPGTNGYDLCSYRGGTGICFDNTVTLGTGASIKDFMGISTYRAIGDSLIGTNWGSCGDAPNPNQSQGYFDVNDGTTYYTGTAGASSSGNTYVDSGSPGWTVNQWSNPANLYPYSVVNTTKGWVASIASNTSNTLTMYSCNHGLVGGTGCSSYNFSNGDSIFIRRSTGCQDGAGRGAGLLVQNVPAVLASTGNPGPGQEALDPMYEWNDVAPILGYGTNANGWGPNSVTPYAQPNREFFTDNSLGSPQTQTSPTSPFNGTSGIGIGTLANRPTTCTANSISSAPGVGYWATDQGSWNTSGNGFGQGVFSTCGPANTWTNNYGGNSSGQPYTYPHPLAGGTAQANPPTASPVGGTYSSSQSVTLSCSNTGCSITYCTDTANTCTPATPYSTPITASSTGYIRAFATATGFVQSSTVFFGYIISSGFTWTPTISPNGSGNLSGTNCVAGTYSSGTTIGPCTANPNTGFVTGSPLWSAVSGSAACSGTTNPCPSFNITANSGATANFVTTPTCANPTQNPPFSGTFTVPPTKVPFSIGFFSPTTGCTMVMTLDGTSPSSTCTIGGSTQAYSGQSISNTTVMRVRACQTGFNSSAVAGGTWSIFPVPGIFITGPSVTIQGKVGIQ